MAQKDDRGPKFERFEVVMERNGRRYHCEVDVKDVRVGRGKHTIVSSGTFCDANHWIKLQTRGAPTYRETIPLTLECINQRGFIPRSYRVWTGLKWGEWNDVAGFPKDRKQTSADEG